MLTSFLEGFALARVLAFFRPAFRIITLIGGVIAIIGFITVFVIHPASTTRITNAGSFTAPAEKEHRTQYVYAAVDDQADAATCTSGNTKLSRPLMVGIPMLTVTRETVDGVSYQPVAKIPADARGHKVTCPALAGKRGLVMDTSEPWWGWVAVLGTVVFFGSAFLSMLGRIARGD